MSNEAQHYDEDFFDRHDEPAKDAAAEVYRLFPEWFRPQTVIDVGCGSGQWLREAQRQFGAEVLGADGPWNTTIVTSGLPYQHVDLERAFDLDTTFDLAICLEVAEHLSDTGVESLLNSLTDLSDVVLFSGAVVDQPGENHINCRWQSEWMAEFTDRGFEVVDELRPALWKNSSVAWWYKQNIFIAVREPQRWRAESATVSSISPDVVHPDHFVDVVRGFKRSSDTMWTRLERAETRIAHPSAADLKEVASNFLLDRTAQAKRRIRRSATQAWPSTDRSSQK